jgi:hypothetical protein
MLSTSTFNKKLQSPCNIVLNLNKLSAYVDNLIHSKNKKRAALIGYRSKASVNKKKYTT